MKKMKFLVAILAIAFVVIGSAFTSHKPVVTLTYGVDTDNGLVLSGKFHEYVVYNLADVASAGKTDFCGAAVAQDCKFEIVNPTMLTASSPTLQQQRDNNLIIESTVPDANGVIKTTLLVKVSNVGPGSDAAAPATQNILAAAQLFGYF